MKLSKFEEGKKDCDTSIDLDPTYHKVLLSLRVICDEEKSKRS
jgi:hypothetical protein